MKVLKLFGRKREIVINKEPTHWMEVWGRLRKNKVAMAALIVIILIILAALFANQIADYQTKALAMNPRERLLSPSWGHWFGTDAYGRDLFARVVHGARYSLTFGIVCTLLSIGGGSILGAIAAFFGGKTEMLILRVMDAIMSIPSMLLTLSMVTALGLGMRSMVIAMVVSNIPYYTRMVHSVVISVVHQEYISAARSIGTPSASIIVHHVLPNAIGPIIVNSMMNVAGLIMGAAGLSFIGMGIQPPSPEWGSMLQESISWMRQYPHLVIFPGMAIVITALAFNLLGDGLADALDPRRSEL